MIFCNKNKTCCVNDLREPIVQVESTKFLWVFIDSQLSWKPHINAICNKLAKSIGIITRLRSIFPDTILP